MKAGIFPMEVAEVKIWASGGRRSDQGPSEKNFLKSFYKNVICIPQNKAENIFYSDLK